jgi:hypothetical protein
VKRVTDTGSIGSYFGSKFHCIYSFLSMSVLPGTIVPLVVEIARKSG